MLQAIRSKAAGIVVKVLFSVLVVSFAIWGVGDYTFLRRTGEDTALKVGSVSVPAATVEQEYRTQVSRLRQQFGDVDRDLVRQFGLMDQIVQNIVTRALMDQAAEELGIRIGDDLVRTRLMSLTGLQEGGVFSRARFQQYLYESQMSEATFLAQFRRDLAREMVTDALTVGVRAPEPMVDRLYRYRNEKREAESVFVPASSFQDVGTPDDAQVQSLYDENKDRFTAPEYRTLTVVRVGPEEIQPNVHIDDAQLQDEYRARLPEISTPERRELEHLLLADEDAAKSAHEKLAAGGSFADVATAIGRKPEDTKFGLVAREDLPPDLRDPVFALKQGETSAPLRSPFGWHIFRTDRIEPGHEPTLAEVKDRLVADLGHRLASEATTEYANRLEDAISAGGSLEEAATKVGVKATKIDAIDARGQTPTGQPAPLLQGAGNVLAAAFETAANRETQLIEGRDGVWYVARVDNISPSALKPLPQIRDEVVAMWQAEKRQAAAKERAEAIFAAANSGRSLEEAAGLHGIKPTMIGPVARQSSFDMRSPVPSEVVGRLFTLKPNDAASVDSRDGTYVIRLKQVIAADPAADATAVQQLRDELRQQIGSDVVAAYIEAVRRRVGVTIYRPVLDKIS